MIDSRVKDALDHIESKLGIYKSLHEQMVTSDQPDKAEILKWIIEDLEKIQDKLIGQ